MGRIKQKGFSASEGIMNEDIRMFLNWYKNERGEMPKINAMFNNERSKEAREAERLQAISDRVYSLRGKIRQKKKQLKELNIEREILNREMLIKRLEIKTLKSHIK